MPWQYALFLNVVFAVFRGNLYKTLVNKLDPYLVMFYTNLFGIFTFGGYYIIRYRSLPEIFPEMMILGIIFTVSYGLYLTAVKFSLSQSVVFSNYYIIITMILTAVLLGEWAFFSPFTLQGMKNLLGLGFAATAFYLIVSRGGKKEVKTEKIWFYYMTINIILSGFGSFWSKSFLGTHSPSETLLSQFIGGMIVIPVLVRIRKVSLTTDTGNMLFMVFVSIAEFFNLLFFYEAYKNGPAMIVLPVGALSIMILSAFSGLLLFKESHMFHKGKIWGLILGITGVALLVI